MGLAKEIYKLTEYGVRSNLIEEEDRNYIINRYLEVFGVDEFVLSEDDKKRVLEEEIDLQTVLDKLIDIAYLLQLKRIRDFVLRHCLSLLCKG